MNRNVAAPPPAGGAGPLIIARERNGYRVHAPDRPHDVYFVRGGLHNPTCTCSDFDERFGEHCAHIRAVLERKSAALEAADDMADQRRAVQNQNGEPAKMLVKRSVSPDGRIDSLSIELSYPVAGLSGSGIATKTKQALSLVDGIADEFRSDNDSPPVNGERAPDDGSPNTNGPVAATLVDIGGMDTRWGRRLFLNVRANGRVYKLFGSPKQLGRALTEAGYDQQHIEEGIQLGFPCRISTKPSDDGRYVNVDRLFPPDDQATGWAPQR